MKYYYYYYHYFVIVLIIRVNLIYGQQYYDPNDCSSNVTNQGTRYTCNHLSQDSCKTFLVYRANQKFQAISTISALFNLNTNDLLHLNNLTSSFESLKTGRDVLIPINCSCLGQFFQSNFSYTPLQNTSLIEIACGVFNGLVKRITLYLENPFGTRNYVKAGSNIHLPLNCACPDNLTSLKGIKYLVTYPLIEGDKTSDLIRKFGVSLNDLSEINHLGNGEPTIFTSTTILVPLRVDSIINLSIPSFTHGPSPPPNFLPISKKPMKSSIQRKVLFIVGCVIGIFLLLLLLVTCAIYYIRAFMKMKKGNNNNTKYHSFTTPISSSTCLSPDFLVGIKFSLLSYSMEEIKRATRDFCEENKVCSQVYKGNMDDHNVNVIVKKMRFEETRPVIDLHSKINHINIVKLLGVCYGESDDDFSWCYVVFEYPTKGCLRDCLTNQTTPLKWHQRTQIAFDIATGLHYLNFCTFPSYAHMNLHSRNIFVTSNCRAKLGDIGSTPFGASSKGNYCNNRSVRAPEYLPQSLESDKIDIFAFGTVLLELISGRECCEEKSFRESIRFLGGSGDSSDNSEGGCFEQLKCFMDPSLKHDYSLAETLCLAVLAKACVEDDPLHRPSMEDIIKVLARMVYSF
ncbi:lysM domain receptor-like kinase 4 [Cannabis sativa]|uniref:lysM domain receptor-like kinase 4 n=1 Tax=Cannabis sativa TaxID=3483 RepID=UPI0029CA30FC|nr:lysM domain receptor-like kinase 4 [Cannabis sativa]